MRKLLILSFTCVFILAGCQKNSSTNTDNVSPNNVTNNTANHTVNGTDNNTNQGTTDAPVELIMNETVQYPENEPPLIKVKIGEDWKEISTIEDYPSKPAINGDKTKLAFISPFEFELLGEVWLYDALTDGKTRVFTSEQAGEGKSAKQVLWLDNDNLLILTGNTYGTVTLNDTLYFLNTKDNKLEQILKVNSDQDIRNLQISNETTMTYELATYDDERMNAVTEEKRLDITSYVSGK
ncbi:hypothetical protein D3C77_386790 [compost metagenome]